MAKKTKTRKKQNSVPKTRFLKIFLLIFLFSICMVFVSYLLKSNEKDVQKEDKKIEEKIASNPKKKDEFSFDKIVQKKTEEKVKVEKKELPKKTLEKKEKKESQKKQEKTLVKKQEKLPKKVEKKIVKPSKKDLYKYDKKTRPKLAIIIDDVSSSSQKKKILDIGYKVAMSFLPPTKGHKNSAKIAQDLSFHMIHFPMQASSLFKGKEVNTLNINDSYEKIEQRVKQLRQWYPRAIYTNNHTGSVFTSDDKAMDRLFRALKKYDFIFMDSKTSAKSVAKKYAKKYNMPYIVRNIFLDNKKDYTYIQNQLKKAIKKAKKSGYAIAIGHPHSMTIKVLRESKYLLKDLDLIYIDELPYL